MSERPKIGLDNSAFRGRLKQHGSPVRRSAMPPQPMVMDGGLQREHARAAEGNEQTQRVDESRDSALQQIVEVPPQPFVQPAEPRQQPSIVLKREPLLQGTEIEDEHTEVLRERRGISSVQKIIFGVACLMLLIGVLVSLQTIKSNQAASATISSLSNQVQAKAAPAASAASTTESYRQYTVSPDEPRYLQVPELQLRARVLQSGLSTSGQFIVPKNIQDVSWYTESAKPGVAGATVIVGSAESQPNQGSLRDVDGLAEGDTITLVKGDNTEVQYKVVKTRLVRNQLNLPEITASVSAEKPGLNIVAIKSSEANGTEYIIVFSEQI